MRKCSIITVSYNSEKTIEKTIQSVLDQTYECLEYIIIDGASTDATLDIIKKYESAFEGRLRYISEPDNGIYYAMNKGIDMAVGDLIGIINSDDYYEKDAVENMMKQLGNREGCFIFYGMLRVFHDGIEKSININSHKFMRQNCIAHPTCFVTRQLYDKYGMYDTKYVSAADYDFLLRMSENKDVTFEPVYKVISNFSEGGMSSTSKAYYDLLKVQKDHGIISQREYKSIVAKCKIHDILHRRDG